MLRMHTMSIQGCEPMMTILLTFCIHETDVEPNPIGYYAADAGVYISISQPITARPSTPGIEARDGSARASFSYVGGSIDPDEHHADPQCSAATRDEPPLLGDAKERLADCPRAGRQFGERRF